jgi:hypothetical protein
MQFIPIKLSALICQKVNQICLEMLHILIFIVPTLLYNTTKVLW